MKVPELVSLFVEKRYHLDMGRNKLAQMYNATADDIVMAKSLARGEIARHDASITPKVESRDIVLPSPYRNGNENNVLVIGDTHLPFDLPGYLEFCRDIQENFDCGTVVQIGDLVDNHFMSYHETIPEGFGGRHELDFAKQRVKEWERVFPEMIITLGTHDKRPMRKMRTGMVVNDWLKSFNEVYDTPEWRYVDEFNHNGVKYVHGTSDAWTNMLSSGCSVVQGHLHTQASVRWHMLGGNPIFAMQVGTGINDKAYAFEYAISNPNKSHVSCGVIFEGNPIVINKDVWER